MVCNTAHLAGWTIPDHDANPGPVDYRTPSMSSVLKEESDPATHFLLHGSGDTPRSTPHMDLSDALSDQLRAASITPSNPIEEPDQPIQRGTRGAKRVKLYNRATRAHFYQLVVHEKFLPGDELRVPLVRPIVQDDEIEEVAETGVFTVSLSLVLLLH